MQNTALGYLFVRFCYRIYDFFHHWYAHGSQRIIHAYINFFESLDRTLAFMITVRHFFMPLYQDYSFVGRILGIFFRSVRIAIGACVYAFFGVICALLYCMWIMIPLVLLLSIFT